MVGKDTVLPKTRLDLLRLYGKIVKASRQLVTLMGPRAFTP